MRSIIIVTGAANSIGRSTCGELALAGHTVYASMRETMGRNSHQVEEVQAFAREHDVDLRIIELDESSQDSANSAIETIISENGRLDVVVRAVGRIGADQEVRHLERAGRSHTDAGEQKHEWSVDEIRVAHRDPQNRPRSDASINAVRAKTATSIATGRYGVVVPATSG